MHVRGADPPTEVHEMTAWLVVFGLLMLILLAMGVGAALDTEAQRREGKRLAEERRARSALDNHRAPLCDDCPFRELG